MLLSHVNVGSAQWTKSHGQIVITWSISPDENNNIGLVYRPDQSVNTSKNNTIIVIKL